MANVENMAPEDQSLVVPALQLLKSDDKMEWRVTIQSDSMAMIDYNQQKTERTEFLTAVATFLQSSSTVGQGAPQLIPLMLQMLQFGIAGFRVSKDLEGVFDKYIAEFEQEIEQQKQQPPPPDPERVKMQMEQQAAQAESQRKQQESEAELAMKAQELQMEQQARQQEFQMEQQKFAMEMRQSMMMFMQEMRQMREEFALKMEMDAAKAAQQSAIAAHKAANQPEPQNAA